MINRVVRNLILCFFVAGLSLNVNAEGFSLASPLMDAGLPVNVGAALGLGSILVTNPDQLGALLTVATDTVAGVSPIFDRLLTGGVLVLPEALLDGDTLISPSVTLLPSIWLVNAPLPGL